MNCPHCSKPIPAAAIVKAAASINGHKSRPGSTGLVRNPGGNPNLNAKRNLPLRCEVCGYTKRFAQTHDHTLCRNSGNAPWEKIPTAAQKKAPRP